MTPAEIRQYAETLILDHARDVEFLTVHEMAEEHVPGGEISDEDAKAVHDLIGTAIVTVSWPEPAFGTAHAQFIDHLAEDDR
ncbi:MAG TPA: hypothetical protein VFQ42_04250 [Mycobacterium sp.]|nr:hypothetical protein [Mycobacterium sp.]